VHVGLGVHRWLTLPRTRDSGARRPGAAAGRRSYRPTVLRDPTPSPAEVSAVPTQTRLPARPQPVRRSPARRPPVRRRKKSGWAARLITTLSVGVLAAAGIGHVVVTGLDAGISRIDPFKDMKNRPAAGHGMNILLVGTDGRDRIT